MQLKAQCVEFKYNIYIIIYNIYLIIWVSVLSPEIRIVVFPFIFNESEHEMYVVRYNLTYQ